MNQEKFQNVEVFEVKPEGFNTIVQVAACYLEIEGHLLLLQCSDAKQEARKWGVPAGKIEKNELPQDAARRELFEESGIELRPSDFQNAGTLYIRKPEVEYIYHLFKVNLFSKPEVKLSNEHLAYMWASAKDLETLPLMAGAKKALDKYRAFLAQKNKRQN